uniref:CEP1-DNA_bind domain-containing protein n=1 Tax=Caenorhabditis japonica TaxID=281687 RepID=A0A8R1HYQ5_CAEJA
MNYSQSTESNKTFDEFSQNTKLLIQNGEFLLPGLSQGGVDEIEKDMKGAMETVMQAIEAKPSLSFEQALYTFPACSKGMRQPGLKKRTNRIVLESITAPKTAPTVKEAGDESLKVDEAGPLLNFPTELNSSLDLFSPPTSPEDNIMDRTYDDSVMTFTQSRIDSQSPIVYLRERTEEEQEKVKIKIKQTAKTEDDEQPKEYLMEQIPYVEQSHVMVEEPPLNDTGEQDVFEQEMEEYELSSELTETVQKPGDGDFLTMQVNEAKTKKISDFVSKQMPNGDAYLWTRMDVLVPIEVRWKVDKARIGNSSNLALRVRLVHYDRLLPIENAIHKANTDVKKCRDHTMKEADGVPAESFFYILNSGTHWTHASVTEKIVKGHSFRTVVPSGKNGLDFDLRFTCQEKCMELDEKRKTMCLVVFLEDENGRPINHRVLKEVRVVAYPRRDYKNFCLKADGEYPETKKTPARLQNCHVDMFNGANTSNLMHTPPPSRKRQAREISISTTTATTYRKNDYERQLMLGSSYRAPEDMEIGQNSDYFVDENVKNSAKRLRVNTVPGKMHFIGDDEYDDFVAFMAARAREARDNAARAIRSQIHPYMAQSNITCEMSVEAWLNSLNKSSSSPHFMRNGILTMGDLVNAFERDSEIFTKLGLEPHLIHSFYDIFLNFYRIIAAERLEATRQIQR